MKLEVDSDVTVAADVDVTVAVIELTTIAVETLVTVLVTSVGEALMEWEVEGVLVVGCPGAVPERPRLIRTAMNRIEAMAIDAARKGPDLAEPFLARPIFVRRSHL